MSKVHRFIAPVLFGSCCMLYCGKHVEAVDLPQAELHWNQTCQTIDGFGASQACDVYADQLFEHHKREDIMDLLFSQDNGIGLSIMRAEVGNGLNLPTINPSDGIWDYTPYEPEQWVFQEAKERGVMHILSTVWSPPAWMKTSGRITRGGYLAKEHYQDYATYLANYIKNYHDIHGVTINTISIANEPEYAAPWQSCLWSGTDFSDFLKNYLKPTFEAMNIDADILVGEEATWTDNRLTPIFNDKDARDTLDIVGAHYYHGKPGVLPQAKQYNKRIWETEVSDTIGSSTGFKDGVKWAKYIHDFMTQSEANAFFYWLGASYKANNESLIRFINQDEYVASKRLFSMGNFSKYVRPGYVRMDITEHPVGNLYLSAYKNEDTGDFAIVAVNNGQNNETATINFNDITINQLTPHITNDRYDLQTMSPIATDQSNVTLSVSGYTTITYTGNIHDDVILEKHQWRVIDELENWNQVYEKSSNWMLEGNNPYNAFDHDLTRARRTKKTDEYIIYKVDNLTDFEATIYYFKTLQGLTFEVSEDGTNWNTINYSHAPATLTGGFWEKIVVSPSTLLPENTNYLKIKFSSGHRAWDKHLTNLKLF